MKTFSGRPIFVCGWPRGGTRMIANLVASHPDVVRSEEVPRAVITAIHQAVLALDKKKDMQQKRKEIWKAMRQDYFLNAIANTYRNPGKGSRFCNKTPSTEFALDDILYCCQEHPPLFVYCARHPMKVIRSLSNMEWNRTSNDRILYRMIKSANVLKSMQSGKADVHVVQVDKVGNSHEERMAFTRSLMDFLELPPAAEIDVYVDEWPVAQPATKVLRGSPVAELSDEERDKVLESETYRTLCERFGYQP